MSVCKQPQWIQQGCWWAAQIPPAGSGSRRVSQRPNQKRWFLLHFSFPTDNHVMRSHQWQTPHWSKKIYFIPARLLEAVTQIPDCQRTTPWHIPHPVHAFPPVSSVGRTPALCYTSLPSDTITGSLCARLFPRCFPLHLPSLPGCLRLFAFSNHRGQCWGAVSPKPRGKDAGKRGKFVG